MCGLKENNGWVIWCKNVVYLSQSLWYLCRFIVWLTTWIRFIKSSLLEGEFPDVRYLFWVYKSNYFKCSFKLIVLCRHLPTKKISRTKISNSCKNRSSFIIISVCLSLADVFIQKNIHYEWTKNQFKVLIQ